MLMISVFGCCLLQLLSQALLSAIGVGEKSATITGATFQWSRFTRFADCIFKPSFQVRVESLYLGSNLDSNAKNVAFGCRSHE
ncbi:hypothetical protein V6N13_035775 [Hibiscus sabdariffa]